MKFLLNYFVPKEENYFALLNEMAAHLKNVASVFNDTISNLPAKKEFLEKIRKIETDADTVTHKTLEKLHQSFITPFDRDDIHALITELDEVIDVYHAIAERFDMFEVNEVPESTKKLASMAMQSCNYIAELVNGLSNLKTPEKLLSICMLIHKLENESDHLYRQSLADLFKNEKDIRKILVNKEIDDKLEALIDHCESIANLIEGIVLDYA